MTYLVDANDLGEPTRPVPNAMVVAWRAANEGDLVIDAAAVVRVVDPFA